MKSLVFSTALFLFGFLIGAGTCYWVYDLDKTSVQRKNSREATRRARKKHPTSYQSSHGFVPRENVYRKDT